MRRSSPRLAEHRLILRAKPQDRFAVEQEARRDDRLVGRVDDQFVRGFEVKLDRVRRAVARCRRPVDIGERAREHVEVVGERGSEEGQVELDVCPVESSARYRYLSSPFTFIGL